MVLFTLQMSQNPDPTHSNTIQTVISLLIFDAGRHLDHKRLRELSQLNQDSRKRCDAFRDAMVWKRKLNKSNLIFDRILKIPRMQTAKRVLSTYMTFFTGFNSFKTGKALIEKYLSEDVNSINFAVDDLDGPNLMRTPIISQQHYYGPYWPSFSAKPTKCGSRIFSSSEINCKCYTCNKHTDYDDIPELIDRAYCDLSREIVFIHETIINGLYDD